MYPADTIDVLETHRFDIDALERHLARHLPGFTAPANYFGIFVPKGVPDEVVKTLEKFWAEQIVKSTRQTKPSMRFIANSFADSGRDH